MDSKRVFLDLGNYGDVERNSFHFVGVIKREQVRRNQCCVGYQTTPL